jgi:hypothetical protein
MEGRSEHHRFCGVRWQGRQFLERGMFGELAACGGPIVYYLGLNVVRDRTARIIYLTQTAAIDRLLEKAGMAECSPCATSMEPGLQLEGAQEASHIVDQGTYAQRVGRLLHLVSNTRPDICLRDMAPDAVQLEP